MKFYYHLIVTWMVRKLARTLHYNVKRCDWRSRVAMPVIEISSAGCSNHCPLCIINYNRYNVLQRDQYNALHRLRLHLTTARHRVRQSSCLIHRNTFPTNKSVIMQWHRLFKRLFFSVLVVEKRWWVAWTDTHCSYLWSFCNASCTCSPSRPMFALVWLLCISLNDLFL